MSTSNVPVTPAQKPAPSTRKPRRWIWILGICAALFVGIGLGAGTAQTRDIASPKAAPASPATVTAPAPRPVTVTAPAPAPVTVTVTAEPPAPAGPGQSLGSGMHEVGVDVQPGRYKTDGPTGSMDMCYWARHKNDSGDFDAIIANNIVQGPGSLTVNAGEFVEITGDCVWTKVG